MCKRCAEIVKNNLMKLTPEERNNAKKNMSGGDIRLAVEMQYIIDSIEKDEKKQMTKKWFWIF